jgi:hypothetical protein
MFDPSSGESRPGIGHNKGPAGIRIEVRLFNSLARFAPMGTEPLTLDLPAGSSVGDAIKALALPADAVHLALRNGRDVTPGLGGGVNLDCTLDNGDILALSGPVPYSWGYGAPVV